MPRISKRLLIMGRVQGVGFRDWLVVEANRLELSGWVRNTGDDTVEALISGNPECIEACVLACHRGSIWAAVQSVTIEQAEAPDQADFIRRASLPRLS
jgi:acylphosphatase